MRTGMSWCAAGLIVTALLTGHRLWGRSATASPPAALSTAELPAELPQLPQRDPALQPVAAGDELPPLAEPGDAALPPLSPRPSTDEETQVRAIIDQELRDAPEEERDIFFDRFRALPPGVVRDLLSVRRLVGSAQENSPLFAPVPPLPASRLDATPEPSIPPQTLRPRSSPITEQPDHSSATLREAIAWHRHNLLNSVTPGFRRIRVLLVDRTHAGDAIEPGIALAPPVLDAHPGEIEETGRPLDIALPGSAWLAVRIDGADRYTRCGALLINGDRRLATVASAGQAVIQPEIVVPAGIDQVHIASDGTVMGELPGQAPQVLGRLAPVTFPAQELLQPVGATLVAANARSGAASPVVTGEDDGRELVRPRSLERSNVDVETERNNIRVLTEQLESLAAQSSPLAAGNAGRTRE